MIITCQDLWENDYQVQMITKNKIPGMLAVSTRIVDGSLSLYYEISGKQTIEQYYEHKEMGWKDIQDILLTIEKIEKNCSQYLLDAGRILWMPKYLYIDYEHREIEGVFYPEYQENWVEDLERFAAYILQRTDHTDERAVMLSYQFYKSTKEINFSIQKLLDHIGQIYSISVEEPIETEAERQEASKVFGEEREGGKENFPVRRRQKLCAEKLKEQDGLLLQGDSCKVPKRARRKIHSNTMKNHTKEKAQSKKRKKRVFFNILLTTVTGLLSLGVVLYFRLFSYLSLDMKAESLLLGMAGVSLALLIIQLLGIGKNDDTEDDILNSSVIKKRVDSRENKESKEDKEDEDEKKRDVFQLEKGYQAAGQEVKKVGMGQIEIDKRGLGQTEIEAGEEVRKAIATKETAINELETKKLEASTPEAQNFELKKEDIYDKKELENESPKIVLYDFLKDEYSRDTDREQMQKTEYGKTEVIPRIPMRKMPVLEGVLQNEKKLYTLSALPCLVGKMKGNVNILIEDVSISRIHARIFEKEGKLYLEDLHSTNGTFHNGILLAANESVALTDGDTINFAEVELVYHE